MSKSTLSPLGTTGTTGSSSSTFGGVGITISLPESSLSSSLSLSGILITISPPVLSLSSVPGIVELRDVNGNRYTNVTNVSVAPLAPTPATAEFNPGSNVTVNNTVYTDPLNGTITVNGVNYTGTTQGTYVFSIDQAPTTGGDLDGLTVTAASSVLNMGTPNVTVATGTTGMTTLTLTIDGITFTFNVNAGTTDSFTATQPGNYIMVNVTPSITQYELGRDYTLEEECLRAGLINIKKNSRIKSGDTVLITCDVPDESYVTVSGAAAGKIEGSLLFSGDPNQGNAVMIEAWKCSIRPKHNWAYAS